MGREPSPFRRELRRLPRKDIGRVYPAIRGILAVAATIACLALLAAEAHLPSVQAALLHADPGLVGVAMVLVALSIACKAARWRAMYPARQRPPFRLALAGIALGQVLNWAVPARLGELARLGLLHGARRPDQGGRGHSGALGVGILAGEKMLDGGMLLLTAGLVVLLVGVPSWLEVVGPLAVAGLGLAGLGVVVVLRQRSWTRRPAGSIAAAIVGRRIGASPPLRRLRGIIEELVGWCTPGSVAQAVAWSFGAWSFGALANLVVLAGLGITAGLGVRAGAEASLAVLAVLYGAAILPSLPGRLGVFQYACIVALGPFGVGADDALAFGITLYAVVYLPPLVVGAAASASLIGPLGRWGRLRVASARPAAPALRPASIDRVEGSASALAPEPGINRSRSSIRPDPPYSVIVPAHNAGPLIEACLRAVADQTMPRDAFEVIVVDDGSTDDTAARAQPLADLVLRQAHAGPACARNRGAQAARGRLLLFTDADCEPTRTWVEELVRACEAGAGIAGVKGTYRSRQRALVARVAQVEFEEKYARLRSLPSIDFVDTGSAAFRADAFWQDGGFDPRYAAASNEDTALSFKLVASGWRLAFAERATVYHRHPESLVAYLRRKWRHGFWRVRVYRAHPTKLAGDSYMPASTRYQFVGALLLVGCALSPVASLRRYAAVGGAVFVLGTIPFVRRARRAGWDVAAATPPILFLRALALGMGLVSGALALPLSAVARSRRWRASRLP